MVIWFMFTSSLRKVMVIITACSGGKSLMSLHMFVIDDFISESKQTQQIWWLRSSNSPQWSDFFYDHLSRKHTRIKSPKRPNVASPKKLLECDAGWCHGWDGACSFIHGGTHRSATCETVSPPPPTPPDDAVASCLHRRVRVCSSRCFGAHRKKTRVQVAAGPTGG